MNPIQYEAVRAPYLDRINRDVMIELIQDWKSYLSAVADLKALPGGEHYRPRSIRDRIKPSVVTNFWVRTLRKSSASWDTASDSDILNELLAFTATRVTVPKTSTDLFKGISFRHLGDATESVADLFDQCDNILASNGLTEHFNKHAELQAEQIRLMIKALRPPMLRNRVSKLVAIQRIECKTDRDAFFNLLLEVTTQYYMFAPEDEAVIPSITILTSAGPVIVNDHLVYIADTTMPAVLLGRPLLVALGIDVEEQLRSLARRSAPLAGDPSDDPGLVDPSFPSHDLDVVPIGVLDPDAVRTALQRCIDDAAEHHASDTFLSELRQLLLVEYFDVFRVQLGPDPPVKLPPAEVRLKPDAHPVMSRSRPLPPLHQDFLTTHYTDLVRFGFVIPNPSSPWGSPSFAVATVGAGRTFRAVVDLRQPNAQMLRSSYPIPYVPALGEYLVGSSLFFTADAFKGFGQIAIAGDIDALTLLSPLGPLTPQRLPQGYGDALFIFQGSMNQVFRPALSLRDLLIFADDFLGHSTSEMDHLHKLRIFLERCLNVSLAKRARRRHRTRFSMRRVM
ncbi:hypothetical protein PBRA_008633 [Plasmodiophora brassicae]|uniref:Reverse transcriptase domain-containing protein n=1 Tax=Plasmodiophora brassicae TaxID=37360 RepID=A0A0G4J378_PLABS|nr:hypothetical protein PBRA_008633 [Plasmodiophora brassicae]